MSAVRKDSSHRIKNVHFKKGNTFGKKERESSVSVVYFSA